MKNQESTHNQKGANTLTGMKKGLPSALEDSDDHDDFNPIKDLMPPSISGEEIDLIGRKRPRDKDPLRCLVDEMAAESSAAGAKGEPHQPDAKRQKTEPETEQQPRSETFSASM